MQERAKIEKTPRALNISRPKMIADGSTGQESCQSPGSLAGSSVVPVICRGTGEVAIDAIY